MPDLPVSVGFVAWSPAGRPPTSASDLGSVHVIWAGDTWKCPRSLRWSAVHKHPRGPPRRDHGSHRPRNHDNTPHMSRPPVRPRPLRGAVFRGSEAVAGGVLTPRQLDGRSWRRLFRDVYADATIPHDHLLAMRGASLVIPDATVISGRSAAHLWGAAMSEPVGAVEIWSQRRFGPVRGVTIRVSPMPSICVTTHRGIPVCTPEHAAWEIAWTLPLFEAMGWIDALARRRHLSGARLVAHCDRPRRNCASGRLRS